LLDLLLVSIILKTQIFKLVLLAALIVVCGPGMGDRIAPVVPDWCCQESELVLQAFVPPTLLHAAASVVKYQIFFQIHALSEFLGSAEGPSTA
jgi:hypothetical protein